jgi:ribokinase
MGRVVVLGSLNVDVVTRVESHPHPGETVLGEAAGRFAGGKGGNQAMAARRAGVEVVMVGRVGADDAGASYLERLHRHGIRTEVPTSDDAPTGTAFITVDEAGENTIVVVQGANRQVAAASIEAVGLGPGDVLLCSLEVSADLVAGAARLADRVGARVVINLAPYATLPHDVIATADPVIVNESEMRQLADSDLIPTSLLVTFGAAGARWDGEEVSGIRLDESDVVDTVGAGDAFCGALAAALAAGADRQAALEAANRAGADSVQWSGAQPDAAL